MAVKNTNGTAVSELERREIPWDKLMQLKKLAELVDLKQIDKASLEIDNVVGDRVLVQEVRPHTREDEAKASSGIVIAEVHYEGDRKVEKRSPDSCSGLVLQVGDAITDTRLRPGTAVLFSEYGGYKYRIGGVAVRVLDASEVICTMRAVEGKRLTEIIVPIKREGK